ncbi:pentapeptide repeat-containing protein [Streptomyces chartreusis]|uniref:pentapeptide repeat-containing protein n=1 Tax=Streptomyces chartreusis TaxID=1969 RepID=UPI00364AFE91
MAHLDHQGLQSFLSTLQPGADIDARGVEVSATLLASIIEAVRDPHGRPSLRVARFDHAHFTGKPADESAIFDSAEFSSANFSYAKFSVDGDFGNCRFKEAAWFSYVEFKENVNAWFTNAVFESRAYFPGVYFGGDAEFSEVKFADATFGRASFNGDAIFAGAKFTDQLDFLGVSSGNGISFEGSLFGDAANISIACGSDLQFDRAVFSKRLRLSFAANSARFEAARFDEPASLYARYATIDMSDAVLICPIMIKTDLNPIRDAAGQPLISEEMRLLAGQLLSHPAKLVSLRGVDASYVSLVDVDLTLCLFSGAFHLDQIRLEGRCSFSRPPRPSGRMKGFRFNSVHRNTVIEEHHWRALRHHDVPQQGGWSRSPQQPDRPLSAGEVVAISIKSPGAQELASIYRQIRKAFEDAKNEPDASDFYYGEMEMRRHDLSRPRAERRLVWAYWLISGYSLRASRALGWLVLCIALTALSLIFWGLPNEDPKPVVKGAGLSSGSELVIETPDPELNLGYSDRLSWKRTEKAARVVVNSVIFRSSGQNLTEAGTYIEMASRGGEPLILGFAAMAVRGRVKRGN